MPARFLLSGILLIALLAPLSALAQTPPDDGRLDLTISPLPINLITEPGHTVTADLRVYNNGSSVERLKVTVLPFDAQNELGQPRLRDPRPGDDFLQWISFDKPVVDVAPQQWATVTATFNVPPQAAFGYYYAVVFSREHEVVPDATRQVIIGGTAVLVLVEARVPHAKRAVEVLEFNVDHPWYEFLPVGFSLKLRNTGNVHVAPRGNIFIDRGSKNDIGILEVNEQQGNILPDSNRIFTSDWVDGFPVYKKQIENDAVVLDEAGEPVRKLTWDFKDAHKLRWGRYKATLLLVYDDGQRDIPIEGNLSFWVIPWRILLAILAVALFVLVGLLVTFRGVFRRLFRRDRTHYDRKRPR